MCDRFISLSSEMLMWLVIISGCKVWDLRQDRMECFLNRKSPSNFKQYDFYLFIVIVLIKTKY